MTFPLNLDNHLEIWDLEIYFLTVFSPCNKSSMLVKQQTQRWHYSLFTILNAGTIKTLMCSLLLYQSDYYNPLLWSAIVLWENLQNKLGLFSELQALIMWLHFFNLQWLTVHSRIQQLISLFNFSLSVSVLCTKLISQVPLLKACLTHYHKHAFSIFWKQRITHTLYLLIRVHLPEIYCLQIWDKKWDHDQFQF